MEVAGARDRETTPQAQKGAQQASNGKGKRSDNVRSKRSRVRKRREPKLLGALEEEEIVQFPKMVVRLLPPLLDESDFYKEVANHVDLSNIGDKYYVKGNYSTLQFQPPIHSRAYVQFENEAAALKFEQAVNLMTFTNSGVDAEKSEIYEPIAEMAFHDEMNLGLNGKTNDKGKVVTAADSGIKKSLHDLPVYQSFLSWYENKDNGDQLNDETTLFLKSNKAKSKKSKNVVAIKKEKNAKAVPEKSKKVSNPMEDKKTKSSKTRNKKQKEQKKKKDSDNPAVESTKAPPKLLKRGPKGKNKASASASPSLSPSPVASPAPSATTGAASDSPKPKSRNRPRRRGGASKEKQKTKETSNETPTINW